MWRCLNDIWGYCSGEPEAKEREEIKSGDLSVTHNKCCLDPKTCGKFTSKIEPVEIKGESYRHTIIANIDKEHGIPADAPRARQKQKAAKREKELL